MKRSETAGYIIIYIYLQIVIFFLLPLQLHIFDHNLPVDVKEFSTMRKMF